MRSPFKPGGTGQRGDISERISRLEGDPRTAAKLALSRQRMASALLTSGKRGARDASELTILRLRSGLSQRQLAAQIETQQANISRLENGYEPNPNLATIIKLAAALKVDANTIVAALAASTAPAREEQ